MNELSQLIGIVTYEVRMHWRRRTFTVITLAMLVVALLVNFLSASDLGSLEARLVSEGTFTAQEAARVIDFTILYATWPIVWVTMLFILPVMVADVIPLDRQLGVRELLHTLPLTPSVYTWGKVLGVWLAAFLCLCLITVLTAIVWWVRVGAFDIGLYTLVGTSGGLVLALLNSTLGVLLASGQPGRRRAVMIAVGVLLIVPILMLNPNLFGNNDFLNYFNPIRAEIFSHFVSSIAAIGENPNAAMVVFSNEGLLTILVGVMQIVVIWIAAWGWQRYREAR